MIRTLLIAALLVVVCDTSGAQQNTLSLTPGQAFLTTGDHTFDALGVTYTHEILDWLSLEGGLRVANTTKQDDISLLSPLSWRNRTHVSVEATVFPGFKVPFIGKTSQRFGAVVGPTIQYRYDHVNTGVVDVFAPDQEEEDAIADEIEQELRRRYPDSEIRRFTFGNKTEIATIDTYKATDIGFLGGLRYQLESGRIAVGIQGAARVFPFGNVNEFSGHAWELSLRLGYRF